MSKSKVKSFAVGDRVSWKSQAGGHWKQKTGTVVEVVPPHKFPQAMRQVGSSRSHESYVVSVVHSSTTKPERYWPLVRNLRLVKRGSTSTVEAAPIVHSDDCPQGGPPRNGEPCCDGIETSVGASVTVDRESFTDVKLVEHGPNTEQMLAQDAQDAERTIASAEGAN